MKPLLLSRLALVCASLFTLSLATHAESYRNRDNQNLGDRGEGFYTAPYQLPSVDEITAVLERVHAFVEKASPTRVIDETTGKEITDFTTPIATAIADRGEEDAYNPWQYTMGVTHAAMLYATAVTGDQRYAGFTLRHMQFIHDRLPYFKKQAAQVKIDPGAEHRGIEVRSENRTNSFRGAILTESLDDCGAIGAALIKARLAKIGPDQLALINHIAEFVANKQFRLADGSWARKRPQPVSLWADDYYMSIPLMAQMTRLTGDQKYIDDAARHFVRAASRLFNTRTQLYTHGWNENQPYNPQFYWGRANGWVAMAAVELLDVLPASHPERPRILELFQLHIQALASLQAPSGMWRNLLDKTDSYEESSCTAMFVYAIAHAINEGWISPACYGSVAQAGWNGLSTHINAQGHVLDTCVGTTFASDNVYYYHRPTSTDATHGVGPAIMAGAEMIRLLKNEKLTIRKQWRTYHYLPKE
ncbi:MAG: glycoside hydrolase family 88 protein [Verrucomicrobia bacterium]|nr:glycoside hydrolase family 88 protein [Verrucomicrobiota bacterium]